MPHEARSDWGAELPNKPERSAEIFVFIGVSSLSDCESPLSRSDVAYRE